MKKKDIEKIPWLAKKARKKNHYSVNAKVVNLKGEDTLIVDISSSKHLVRSCITKKEFATWAPKEVAKSDHSSKGLKAGWSENMLDSLFGYDGCFYLGYKKVTYDISDESEKLIQEYTCLKKYDWYSAIDIYEQTIRDRKRNEAWKRKVEREKRYIDSLTSDIGEIPSEIEEWAKEKVIKHFIHIEPYVNDKATCHCTSCNGTFTIARKEKVTSCPLCHVDATSKRSKYPLGRRMHYGYYGEYFDKALDEEKDFVFLEKCNDKIVQRHIVAERNIRYDEEHYYVYDKGCYVLKDKKLHFFYRKFNYQGAGYWDIYNYGWPNRINIGEGEIYPYADVLANTEYKYSAVELVGNVDPIQYLKRYSEIPQIEVLAKVGLCNIAKTITEKYVNKEGKTPWDILKISKPEYNRLSDNLHSLSWLQYENETSYIKDEVINWFVNNNLSATSFKFILPYMSPTKIKNYIQKQCALVDEPASTIAIKWQDYIDMCKLIKSDITNALIYKPKNVIVAHNTLANSDKSILRAEEINKAFPNADINCKELKDKYSYKGKKYSIVCPEGIKDIIMEGLALGHCLDHSQIYFERIESKESFIVFLRKNIDVDMPFYTLEIEPNGTVRQKRTLGDKHDSSYDDCISFIKRWQEQLQDKLTDEDRELARISETLRVEEFNDLRSNNTTITRGLLAGHSLADVLEDDLMLA